ncbi:MAG TPA: sulfotransferase [Rhodanobacteraceae bacterium]|nr:sulfotransferase [Rhodanobacteraceae bacterium]
MQAVAPDPLGARLREARAYFERDQVAQAEALLRGLCADSPAREDVATLLAEVLRSQGRFGAASEAMFALAVAAGFDAGIALHAAAFARECDRHAVAASICEGALARGVATAELLVLAGHVARESGDFGSARRHYLDALAAGIDLDRQNVLGALANTKRYSVASDPDRARCEAYFSNTTHARSGRAAAGYALAKILGDLGEYARAAAVLREANDMARALRPWDAASWQHFVEARLRERVADAGAPGADFMPVFVTGVPRSGTTLTATLLARATDARDRGELRTLRFIAERLRGGHLASPTVVAEAAGLYAKMARQDDAPARWYVDQDPLNFRWLDIAAAMFPQARVIHLRRDPRDTALSLWSQEFAHPDMAFSSRFGDIAAFMQGHDELMAHWKQTLRIPIHQVDYETLVTEPEAVTAGLAAFIGAPLVPERVDGSAPVTSASVWQARQPVHTDSLGRWRHYAPYLPALARFPAAD